MNTAKELFGYDSLAFFGRVNASISHELKNIMAIISETAGLLNDLSDMASSGTPVDPEMLKNSTGSIIEEIQRGFTTIRQMNRFAHSVDAPIVDIDLMALLDLVCHLSEYLAFTGKTRIGPWSGDPPMARTCPFILQAVIYEIMVQHFQHAGPGAELDIAIQSDPDSGWGIVFYYLSIGEFQKFPNDQLTQAADSIRATIQWDRASDHLKLHVPLTMEPVTGGDGSAKRIENGSNSPLRRESL